MAYLFCSSCAPTLESPAELCLYKTHIYCKRRGNIEFAVSLGIFAILSCVALLCLLCRGSSLVFAGLGIGAIMIGSVALGVGLTFLYWSCSRGLQNRIRTNILASSDSSSLSSSKSDFSLEFELNEADVTISVS
ncbi:inclusion membrane protein [Chlamydia trachomatis]|uniref:Candidate inclusion membrane protein n=1 Tax=Chlamydia trachomatis serovar L2b (strain UCH-1/proctitis) TaxID=471473 RepID=A0A6H2W4H5_CHLTB|nr:inclusion membrane protein [Chlamydia trachomatis]AKC30876.1 inclusion membrane protein [Chlamydia trachomatis]AKC31786.1 inclusion membrane protein [Chlamydia trachomatis]UYF97919.1 hypothetical protein ODL24_00120 [Chlamydia trachomatis]CAP06873.1 candidate inclusion membrane protein [Chlamydia trachomatis L2b/UCH-1/proctitis]CCP51512.1 hypothetical protein L2B8200_00232 [Chlamydia trachomatis L2b/8200/07]